MSKNGKVIAIWGSPGSGKTTVSVELAKQLAKQNKDVLLVFTDIIAPDMSVLLPDKKDLLTMGNVWSNPNCNSELIMKTCQVTQSDRICFLGYKAGENVFSYSEYTKENVYKVYNELESIADYVIVDCVSYFAYNMLSAVALECADTVIRLGEATLKSFSFFDSNMQLIASDGRYKTEEHVKVLSKTKSFQARELAKSKLGTQYELPYVESIEMGMLNGSLFTKAADKGYQNEVERIRERLESEV